MRTRILIAIVAAGLLVGSAPVLADHETVDCFDASGSEIADARGHDRVCVDIVDLEPFDPAVLIVDAGTDVTWRNAAGNLQHTVTSGASSSGDSFDMTVTPHGNVSHTFGSAGVTYYHCEINAFHEATMHGAVVVS